MRLVLALRHLAEQHEELQMIVRGFEKHMRRNPFTESEIVDALGNIRMHIDMILGDVRGEVAASSE